MHQIYAADTMRIISKNIGSIIKNSDGDFIAALAANIGETSNVMAELWAIREGLIPYRNWSTHTIQNSSQDEGG